MMPMEEALAINYLTHGLLTAVNNVWAWLAFLTAAVSFWKIKSSIQYSSPLIHIPSSQSTSTVAELHNSSTIHRTTTTTSSTAFCTLEKTRSGKFSVYYPHDDHHNKQGVNFGSINHHKEEPLISEEEERPMIRRNHYEQALGGWEAVLKMKTSNMDLYRYQDLTVLNGNVVQLWNEIASY